MIRRVKDSLMVKIANGPRQLPLGVRREMEPDRNFYKGGRSFYFFDFDDNIAVLTTAIFIFHKETGHELALTSREFAEQSRWIGSSGPYKDYKVSLDDATGSFRNFRDRDHSLIEGLLGRRQVFVEDLMQVLGAGEHWKGPSWDCFYHAVFNQRPVSVITARGHHPKTLVSGIRQFVAAGHLPKEPNYLSLFPVSHPEVREELAPRVVGDILRPDQDFDIAKLKQAAIRASVEEAVFRYGDNPHHRFGMSDDDPRNIELIVEEMARLKETYQGMSFFVIATHQGEYIKKEVFKDHTEDLVIGKPQQLTLF